MQKRADSDICLASFSLLILLLSLSSASANLGDTKDEAIKAYGQSIGSDKGLTAYHKGDWLIAEAYDAKGKCVICTYFKLFGAINDEDAATLDKETFQSMLALTTCRKRSLLFLIAGYGPPKISRAESFPTTGKAMRPVTTPQLD